MAQFSQDTDSGTSQEREPVGRDGGRGRHRNSERVKRDRQTEMVVGSSVGERKVGDLS